MGTRVSYPVEVRLEDGYRKITTLFCKESLVNHKVVQRVMQKNEWQCRVKMKKRKKTGQHYHVAVNLLERNLKAERPLQKLVIDITYLPFSQKNNVSFEY